jgi:hypothetical protein
LDPFHAVTIACLQAAIEVGAGSIILETDALLVKYAIATDAYDLAPVGFLIEEIKELW